MNKTLILTRSLYPRPGGSSYVMENLCRELDANKHIVIHERDFVYNYSEHKRSYAFPKVYGIKSTISIKNRGERFFQIFKLPLFLINLYQIFKICKNEKVNEVICIYPDGYFMYLGHALVFLMSIRSYHLYFHNTYVENRSGINKLLASFIQNAAFKKANTIFTMSEALNNLYKKNYTKYSLKFQVLPHIYRPSQNTSKVETIPNRFLFTGNFNESNIDSTKRLVDILTRIKRVEICFATPVPKTILQLRGIPIDKINYLGYIPVDTYENVLNSAEFLVLTHGFTGGYSSEEYETIFPTRTLPLLAAHGNLIVHAPENSFLIKFLKPYDIGLLLTSNDSDIIFHELVDFMRDKNQQQICSQNKKAALEYFSPSKVTKFYNEFVNG